MTYTVPASKASINQNRFEFHVPGITEEYESRGQKKTRLRTFSVPKLKFLKPHLLAGLEGTQKVTAMLRLLDEYYPGVQDQDGSWTERPISYSFEDGEQLVALYEAWAEESGLKLGERSASSDS